MNFLALAELEERRKRAERQRMDHEWRRSQPGYPEYASGAIDDLATVDTLSSLGLPVVSDAADTALATDAAMGGRWGDAAIYGAAAVAPFVAGPALKAGVDAIGRRIGDTAVGNIPMDPELVELEAMRQALPGDVAMTHAQALDRANKFRAELGAPPITSGPMAKNYAEALRRPGFRHREQLSQAGSAEPVIDVLDRPPPPQAQLKEGQVLVPLMGDATRRGDVIREVGGIPVHQVTEGGPEFAVDHAGTGIGWASEASAANNKVGNVNKAANQGDPVMVYTTMGYDSPNFSTHPADIAMQQMPKLKINKKAKEAFDKQVRSLPSGKAWLGIDHPDAYAQINARGNGQLRKAFLETMRKKEHQYAGFPDYDMIIEAVTVPELLGKPVGTSGRAAIAGLPGVRSRPADIHSTYGSAIPGDYIGALPELPVEQMFPDIWRNLTVEQGKKPADAWAAMRMRHTYQPVTEEVLRNLGM